MPGPPTGHTNRGQTPGAAAARVERNAKIWKLSIEGWSQSEIARHFGITPGRVCQLVNAAAKAIQQPAAEALIAQENSKLDAMERAVRAVLTARHVVIRGDGVALQWVLDDTGEPVRNLLGEIVMREIEDDAPVLQAVDRLLKVAERRARLNGLDAPTKVEQTTYSYSVNGVEVSDSKLA